MFASILLTSLVAVPAAVAQSYSLTDTYSASNWWDKFTFFTGADPTAGFVDYVDYDAALNDKLIPSADVASWGVDNTTTISATGAGRASVRISSTATYNHGLFIADIAHMPDSTCGLWPAYWFLGQTGTWPNSGELDVIEGVNNVDTNLISAHTKSGCSITGSGQTGSLQSTDCAVPDGTTGCSTSDTRTSSYGSGFNQNGGGIYVVEWTSSSIDVWFFPRSSIPSSISSGSPDPSSDFGTPTAVFGGGCDIDSMFFDMAIVFDTTFCGSWAGSVYSSNNCQAYGSDSSLDSCNAYVAENPGAFDQAYWSINSIKVYTESDSGSDTDTTSAASTPTTSSDATTATQTTFSTSSSSSSFSSAAAESETSTSTSTSTSTETATVTATQTTTGWRGHHTHGHSPRHAAHRRL